MKIGGVVLTAQSSRRRRASSGSDRRKLLPSQPRAGAHYRRTTSSAHTEIYDNMNTRQPRRFDVTVRLLSENGTEAFVSRDEVTNNATPGQKPWETFGYPKEISLNNLAPGRYLLRVEAHARGNEDVKPVARETVITVTQ